MLRFWTLITVFSRPQLVTVTYGPPGDLFRYNCLILPMQTSDSTISCTTAAGQGLLLNFRVAVGYGSSANVAIGRGLYTDVRL